MTESSFTHCPLFHYFHYQRLYKIELPHCPELECNVATSYMHDRGQPKSWGLLKHVRRFRFFFFPSKIYYYLLLENVFKVSYLRKSARKASKVYSRWEAKCEFYLEY